MPVPATPSFVAWGELLWDLFEDGPRLGGAAANAAYHARCLHAESMLVSRVGADELGARAIAELRALGVNVDAIQVDLDAPTGTVHVELVNGEPRYRIAEGVAWDHIDFNDELAPAFARADVVLFGTLAQRSPLGFEAVARALAHTSPSTLRVCDLNVREPYATRRIVEQALALARVLKLNENELRVVEGLFERRDVLSFLLHEWDIDIVAVTRGPRGAFISTRHERVEHPGFPLTASDGDAVGAGDAFSAALGLELWRGAPLLACLERASRYAAHVASRRGGMPAAPARGTLGESDD